jgi:hypothetical protein
VIPPQSERHPDTRSPAYEDVQRPRRPLESACANLRFGVFRTRGKNGGDLAPFS